MPFPTREGSSTCPLIGEVWFPLNGLSSLGTDWASTSLTFQTAVASYPWLNDAIARAPLT